MLKEYLKKKIEIQRKKMEGLKLSAAGLPESHQKIKILKDLENTKDTINKFERFVERWIYI